MGAKSNEPHLPLENSVYCKVFNLSSPMKLDGRPRQRPYSLILLLSTACLWAFTPAAASAEPTVEDYSIAAAHTAYGTLRSGSTGEPVRQVQAMLSLMGYYAGDIDGLYQEATAAAVSQFQTAAGLSADGIVGPATWQKLLPAVSDTAAPERPTSPETEASSETPSAVSLPTLRLDDYGPAVANLQNYLKDLELYSGPIDGIFGEQTQAAVERLQQQGDIEVDGIVGPATWALILR